MQTTNFKKPGRLTAGVRLLQDGAQPNTSVQTAERPDCNSRSGKFCSIHHIYYIPDLALSDL
jgi:hypothetical protein